MREVDDSWPVFGVQQDIEFVKVTVYESEASKLQDQLHQDTVQCSRVMQLVHLTTGERDARKHRAMGGGGGEGGSLQGVAAKQLHHHTVSVVVHRLWNRKSSLMKSLGRKKAL